MKGGKLLDPAWRRERALKAGAGARRAHLARAEANAARFKTKAEAFRAGDKQGYYRAYRAWKLRYDALVKRFTKAGAA